MRITIKGKEGRKKGGNQGVKVTKGRMTLNTLPPFLFPPSLRPRFLPKCRHERRKKKKEWRKKEVGQRPLASFPLSLTLSSICLSSRFLPQCHLERGEMKGGRETRATVTQNILSSLSSLPSYLHLSVMAFPTSIYLSSRFLPQ